MDLVHLRRETIEIINRARFVHGSDQCARVTQCAEIQMMALGFGRAFPAASQARENSLSSITFIGFPCPTNKTGIFSDISQSFVFSESPYPYHNQAGVRFQGNHIDRSTIQIHTLRRVRKLSFFRRCRTRFLHCVVTRFFACRDLVCQQMEIMIIRMRQHSHLIRRRKNFH